METALSKLKNTWSTMKFAYKSIEGFQKLLVLNVPKNWFELSKKTRLLFRTIFHQRTFRSSDSHSTNGSRSSKLLNKSTRFYFISSINLLDILSKGRHPKEIEQHFSKVFDNLVKVEWVNENTVIAIISKEGEKVDFLENDVLSGSVEVWLQKLLDSARSTLKEKLVDAASAVYDKDSRPQ